MRELVARGRDGVKAAAERRRLVDGRRDDQGELLELAVDHALQARAILGDHVADERGDLLALDGPAVRVDVRDEVGLERRRGEVAIVAVGRQRALADLAELRVDVTALEARDLVLAEARRDHRAGRRAPEPLAECGFGQDHADREDVGAIVDALAADLLGRHVVELAAVAPGLREAVRVGALRDPEVENLRDALRGDDHVRRREVAMHDLEQLAVDAAGLVRVIETVEDLRQDLQRDRDRNPALLHRSLA